MIVCVLYSYVSAFISMFVSLSLFEVVGALNITTAMTAKMIWMRRNSVTQDKGFIHPNMFAKRAKEELQAFKNAPGCLTPPRPNNLQTVYSWEKPLEGA